MHVLRSKTIKGHLIQAIIFDDLAEAKASQFGPDKTHLVTHGVEGDVYGLATNAKAIRFALNDCITEEKPVAAAKAAPPAKPASKAKAKPAAKPKPGAIVKSDGVGIDKS